MKKTFLISVGILIILLVIGVWVYLLMNGKPDSVGDIFARFGSGKEDVVVTTFETDSLDSDQETTVEVLKRLNQLTTRPVAGATFIGDVVRYVEQGTGHVYEIDVKDGSEVILSGTTIPQTVDAIFSNDGRYLAIQSQTKNGRETFIGQIDTSGEGGGLKGKTLPLNVYNIAFNEMSAEVFYSVAETGGSSGHSYDIEGGVDRILFTIPLRDVRVLWGNPPYVYITPTSVQDGYVYEVVKNNLSYVTQGGKSLMALSSTNVLITTKVDETGLNSVGVSSDGRTVLFPVPLIPEKCVLSATEKNSFFCTVPRSLQSATFPDDWYKGSVSFSDLLWEISIENGASKVLSTFLTESGREIDVYKIGIDETGTLLWFINKNDNTLWIFDTTLEPTT